MAWDAMEATNDCKGHHRWPVVLETAVSVRQMTWLNDLGSEVPKSSGRLLLNEEHVRRLQVADFQNLVARYSSCDSKHFVHGLYSGETKHRCAWVGQCT
jgi:hypothetical protein